MALSVFWSRRASFPALHLVKQQCRQGQRSAATLAEIATEEASTVLPNYQQKGDQLHTVPLSLTTANQKEVTSYKIRSKIQKFQLHDSDCGSASVQIAVMTEKITNLARHFALHKKDKHSWRGFQMLISRRKQMLIYLKRSDFAKFRETVTTLNLQKEAASIR
jgi:small subunit ribosomal protein S15